MKKVPAKKSKKGFTLIELVVVIAILGILAAILIPVIGGFITRANVAADQANARNVFNTVSMYLATGGATEQGHVDAETFWTQPKFTELYGTGGVPVPRTNSTTVAVNYDSTTKSVTSVQIGTVIYYAGGYFNS